MQIYCAALIFHEAVTCPDGVTIYAPRALVIVSHWPFFDLFKRTLVELYTVASSTNTSPQAIAASAPFWRTIKHFLEEVPLPPEGTTAIKFHIGQASLCFGRSNPSDYPCIQTAVAPLLASFPAKVAVQLLLAVASEHRVLLVSSHMHMLTLVSESLRVLLFPLKFCHTYIPVLPSSMLSFIHRKRCFPVPTCHFVPCHVAHRRPQRRNHTSSEFFRMTFSAYLFPRLSSSPTSTAIVSSKLNKFCCLSQNLLG